MQSDPSMERRHYIDKYLLEPTHNITVNLIGVGGTGSVVLSLLPRMHYSLKALGYPAGFDVTIYDGDTVSEANVIKQLFHSSEIGQNKAIALTTRINRFFELDWKAVPSLFTIKDKNNTANITITCTDTVKSRKNINKSLVRPKIGKYGDMINKVPFYWLDIGNRRNDGQIVLGTPFECRQPESKYQTVSKLPSVLDLYQNYAYLASDSDQGPSCSLMEAIQQQDLFINGILAHLAINLLWKLFTQYYITEHALFVNLETNIVKSKKV